MEKNHIHISIKKSLLKLTNYMMLKSSRETKIGKLMNLQHLELLKAIKLTRKNKKVYCITPSIPSQVLLKILPKSFLILIVAHLLAKLMLIYLK